MAIDLERFLNGEMMMKTTTTTTMTMLIEWSVELNKASNPWLSKQAQWFTDIVLQQMEFPDRDG